MTTYYKRSHRTPFMLVCLLLLSTLFVSCTLFGGEENKASTGTPTATQSTPDSTPAPEMKTYTGEDYSIGYPQDWTMKEGTNQVTFEQNPLVKLSVQYVPNPGALISAENAADTGVKLLESTMENVKEESSENVTIGGHTWVKKTLSAQGSEGGQATQVKAVVLVTNNPERDPNTKAYSITYYAPELLFSTSDTAYFQQMVQSFTFTQH